MTTEGAVGLMDLQEQTKQFVLCVLWMYVELGIQNALYMVTSLTRQMAVPQHTNPPVRKPAGAGPTETSWHHQCDWPAHQ